MSDKAEKSDVDYSFGKESARCGICEHFRQLVVVAGTCTKVKGMVVSVDWCKLFETKKVEDGTPS